MAEKKLPARIIVKVGSQVLCNRDGMLDLGVLGSLARQLGELRSRGSQIVLVSSGAVAAGAGIARSDPGARQLESVADPVARKQAFAALGQVRLMETWRHYFGTQELAVAQVLATRSDFQTRRHYLNMRTCIETLLKAGIVPIVNENDVVAVTELMFTDNDELAGLIAGMVDADLLCLLSTVPGVFQDVPDAAIPVCIPVWDDALHQVDVIVRQGTSAFGRGGMHSKIAAARKASRLGCDAVIADGTADGIVVRIAEGQAAGTRFPALRGASPAKRWLASAKPLSGGRVIVNAGAESVLLDRSRLASLLLVGVARVEGPFQVGDVIEIRSEAGRVLGCGRARYDHQRAEELKGQHGHKPLIHYDYLYLPP